MFTVYGGSWVFQRALPDARSFTGGEDLHWQWMQETDTNNFCKMIMALDK